MLLYLLAVNKEAFTPALGNKSFPGKTASAPALGGIVDE